MVEADKTDFVKVVMGFAELKGKQLSLPALELYWAALSDWDLIQFKAAAAHLLKTCEFMPTPKDFEDLRKAGRATAGEAFAIAVAHAASSAYRRGVTGVDLIDRCVRMIGGYGAIAICDEDKLHFLERRFVEHYGALEDAEEVRHALPAISQRLRLDA
jgi:hypothetical protein